MKSPSMINILLKLLKVLLQIKITKKIEGLMTIELLDLGMINVGMLPLNFLKRRELPGFVKCKKMLSYMKSKDGRG